MKIIIISFMFLIFILIIILINELEELDEKHRVKSKDVYDILNISFKEKFKGKKEKIPYNICMIPFTDFQIEKLNSLFFSFYIMPFGYVSRWSKSAKLIKSFWLTKKETKKLEKQKYINNNNIIYGKYR